MSSIADARAHGREPVPHPNRRNIAAVASIASQRDYYLGTLLAQAERDAALDPVLASAYDDNAVRDHLLDRARGGSPPDPDLERHGLRLQLLAVMERVATDWSLPFDLPAARTRITAAAYTAAGANTAVDHARHRAHGGAS